MTETATPAPDDVPAYLRHDANRCSACLAHRAHVAIVAERNRDRVLMYAVVGFRPLFSMNREPYRLTFWTGHDGGTAFDVFRQVRDFVSEAELAAAVEATGGDVGAAAASRFRARGVRLVGEPGAEAVTFKGPAVRPPLPPTPPAPPMEPAERHRPPGLRFEVDVKPGRPGAIDPWASWWAGVVRACRRIVGPRRHRRPS